MGRVKSRFVKSSATKIYNMGADEFSTDFEKNKELVAKFAEISSKKLRNTIAGYITRIVKSSQAEE